MKVMAVRPVSGIPVVSRSAHELPVAVLFMHDQQNRTLTTKNVPAAEHKNTRVKPMRFSHDHHERTRSTRPQPASNMRWSAKREGLPQLDLVAVHQDGPLYQVRILGHQLQRFLS